MSIRKAIYDLLNDTEADVYPLIAPQELTDPYAVYSTRIEYIRSHDGVEVNEAYVTVQVYANTLATCIALADSLSAALEGASGTYDTTETLHVGLFLGEVDGYFSDIDKYMITQDYLFKFI